MKSTPSSSVPASDQHGAGAAAAGARFVVAIDPVQFKRDKAREFGATNTFASMEEALEPLTDLTRGALAHSTILTVGELEGDHVAPALALTGKGGQVVVTAIADWRRSTPRSACSSSRCCRSGSRARSSVGSARAPRSPGCSTSTGPASSSSTSW